MVPVLYKQQLSYIQSVCITVLRMQTYTVNASKGAWKQISVFFFYTRISKGTVELDFFFYNIIYHSVASM